MARTRSNPIKKGEELKLEFPRRRRSPSKKSASPMEDHPIQSLETEESNGECSHPDIQVVITLARAIIPSPGDDAMVVDEVGPGLDAMQTDDATAPSPVRSVHFASEMDVDYPVVSAPIYTPIPALAPAPASRGTAWVTWIISFFNFLPDVPAMGNMDLLQELTNLATAGWLPRTLTRGTDGPPDSPRRHRRRHRRRRSSSQRRSSSPGSSTDSPPRAQVLAPQNATPIRRGPRSYAAISNRRRIEAIGSMKSTLFRVSDLVPPDQANEENKANSTNTDDRRTDRVADTDDTRVDTVQMATDTTETTNPAGAVNQAGHTNQASDTNQGDVDNQPGSWSRWIFNSVSRRWTAIRGRVAPHGNETKEAAITETQRSTGTETKIDTGSDAPSTTPETPATDTVEASMMPVVLTGPSSTGHPPKPPFAHLLRPRAPSKYRVASNKARKRAAEAYAKELAAKEAARDAAAKEAAAKKAAAKKAAAEKAAAEKADSPQNQEDRDKRTLEKLGSELRSGKVNPLHLPPNWSLSSEARRQFMRRGRRLTTPLQQIPEPNAPPLTDEECLELMLAQEQKILDAKKDKKPPSPQSIPGPSGGGYGLDESFFIDCDSDEGDFAEAQYELETRISKKRKLKEENKSPNKRRKHVITTSRAPTKLNRRIAADKFQPKIDLSPIGSEGDPETPKKDERPTGPSRPVTGSELKGGPKPPKNDKQPSGSSLPVSDSELRGGPNIPRDDKQPTGPSRPVTNPRGTFSVPGWFSSPSSAGAPSSAEKGPAPASSTPGPSILKKPSSAGTPSGSAAKPHADPSSTPGPSILKKPSSTAATSTPNDDISPVSRARNKAEVFKPKTPSRLRETTPSVRESLVRSATQMNESFPNAEWVDTSAQDWLVEICPNGNFKKLPWPEPDEVGEDEAAAQSWVNLAVKKDETITQAAISQWQAMMTATS